MGLTLLLLALVAADPPAEKDKDSSPRKPNHIVDRTYRPAVGDRAVALNEDEKGETSIVWAATTPAVFREYLKAEAMEDEKRLESFEKDGKVVQLEDETPILVMAIEPVTVAINAERFVSDVAIGVRVLEGPYKDKLFLTPIENVVRILPIVGKPQRRSSTRSKKAPKPEKDEAPKKAPDPAARAASLFKLGESLEKAGKTVGALDFYRKTVKLYPGTPSARTAAQRIEALDPK